MTPNVVQMDLNGQAPPEPSNIPPGCSDLVQRQPPEPQVPGVHPSIRSRCWRSATEFSLHSEPPPGFVRRFLQWALFGWRWEAVVVVTVPVEKKPE